MPDLFISYSRLDGDFARKLHQLLTDKGKDIWVDFEDIPLSSSWWEEIRDGIESSDTFVFVLSPHSVSSPICNFEIDHAITHNKRIVPIVRQLLDVEDGYTLVLDEILNDTEVQILGTRNLEDVARGTWASIARHNWLFFDDDDLLEENTQKLLEVLETDLSHVRTHTRLLVRAREWEEAGKPSGMLLTDTETAEAELWMARGGEKIPDPTALHIEYIHASRLKQRQRQRRTLIIVSVALFFSIILALVALASFIEANNQGNQAETNAQAALFNAETATFAQGEAINQANAAATNAQQAFDFAETAAFAQLKAEINGTDAAISAIRAATQAQLALDSAAIAETAQANAEEQAAIAETQSSVAESNRQDAIRAQDSVAIERDRARSIALAALAENELDLQTGSPDPERAIILGIAALERFGITWQAERALGYAVANTLSPSTFFQHETRVTAIELSGDGSWMATADEVGVVLLWDANVFRVMQRLTEHTASVTAVQFSPNWSRLLTTSEDTTARIWDTETGAAIQPLRGHSEAVLGGVWSPDGTQVLTFSVDGEAIIWDAENGDIMARLTHDAPVLAADWSPAGSLIVTGADDGLARVWSVDGTLLSTYEGHLQTKTQQSVAKVTTVSFAPTDDFMIATGGTDENVHIWNAQTGEDIAVFDRHVLDISQVFWSNNGKWLASIDGLNANSFTQDNASARIWSVEDETRSFAIFAHDGLVTNAAWSPNNARLATVGTDAFIYITDAASGGQLLGLRENEVITVIAWSSSGDTLITGNERGAIRVWSYWANAAELVAYARSCCTPRALTDEEARQFGVPIPTSIPVAAENIVQCDNGSAAQRLYVGTRATVLTSGSPAPLNVRNRPSLLARIDAQISPGLTFRVIDGPLCDDRNPIAWYEVQFGLSAETGFIAELQGDEYFVEPLP
ncbi:MAG: TIR domain-containing protein [Anaerolineae bacterium]|nr:TIR domain-containing protein [Anaerolineae bacterium]